MTDLDALCAEIEDACQNVAARTATWQRRGSALDQMLGKALRDVAERADAPRAHNLNALRDRVVACMDAGAYDDLTTREAGAAAGMVMDLGAPRLQTLLAHRPDAWPKYVRAAFREWDALVGSNEGAALCELLSTAPTASLPGGAALVPHLRDGSAPRALAQRLLTRPLTDVVELIERRLAVTLTSDFCGHILARTIAGKVEMGASLDAVWQELRACPAATRVLLPAPRDPNRTWFGHDDARRAARTSVRAQTIALTALIGAARGRPGTAEEGELIAGLVESTMGDPRIPPESHGWKSLRDADPGAYAFCLERLVREDLQFFFEWAMRSERRRSFWLKYARSIRRTTCILAKDLHERLQRELRGATPAVRASLSHARKFLREPAGGVNAFCLYFDTHVALEFSEEGNAAVIYDRATFERRLEPYIANNQCARAKDLRPDFKWFFCRRLTHQGDWEWKFSSELAALGITC